MTSFFWVAQSANTVTLVVSLAALLVVVWLGPRRWTNLSFALLLSAVCLWMGGSMLARLFVNVPQLGGDAQLVLNWLSLGFASIGITLFWFVESFERLPRQWFWAVNTLAIAAYLPFTILLFRHMIITNPTRDFIGGLHFTISPLGVSLSAFLYGFIGLAVLTLWRQRAWRQRWHLTIGVLIVVATIVVALVSPAITIQTYMIPIGMLFMTYEVVKQQLFNPLLQVNQHLEAEVKSRTSALAASLAIQERVQSELTIARDIQLSLLPRSTPQLPHLRVAGRSIPAREVGGDFFTYHLFADGRLEVAVGDVSGKGIPAALLMAFSLRTFEMLVDAYCDQGALLTACNGALAPRLLQSNMQTGFLTVAIDGARREAALATAGMIAPLWWRDGAISYVDTSGLPLGAAADISYEQRTIMLQPGDMLLLVSDGIVEAMNQAKEIWGFARLETVFAALGGKQPQQVVDGILAHVQAFTAGADAHDDMTVVALQVVDEA